MRELSQVRSSPTAYPEQAGKRNFRRKRLGKNTVGTGMMMKRTTSGILSRLQSLFRRAAQEEGRLG